MKTISARKFRLGFEALSEPVSVLRRDPDGNFQVVGTWTPADGAPSFREKVVAQVAGAALESPKIASVYVGPPPVEFRPAPKITHRPSSRVKR